MPCSPVAGEQGRTTAEKIPPGAKDSSRMVLFGDELSEFAHARVQLGSHPRRRGTSRLHSERTGELKVEYAGRLLVAATDPHALTPFARAVGRSERLRRDLTAAEASGRPRDCRHTGPDPRLPRAVDSGAAHKLREELGAA